MTVKKATRCGGFAAVVARQRLQNSNQTIDLTAITKTSTTPNYNISVEFNEKDQLQLTTREEGSKGTDSNDKARLIKDYSDSKPIKSETIKIDDINNCVNVDTYPNCNNTLVFYITKNLNQEAVALRFENEQDFKRIYFTYKYFKMRNRLTKNSSTNYASSENLFTKKKIFNDSLKVRKNSIDSGYGLIDSKGIENEYDLMKTTDNDGVTHISVQQKNLNTRFDQPMSLIGLRSNPGELGEIDSVIYTDIDIPIKPDRKRLFQRAKSKAPMPPANNKDNQKVLKGEFVRVNVERVPDVIPKDNKTIKIPDILVLRDNKQKMRTPSNNVWSTSNKVSGTGYESDREEWRSRSQFSTSAFDSLARPTKMAMAFTLRKPFQRTELLPQYYRLAEPKPQKITQPFTRPNNYIPRPPRLPRPPEIKRNQLNSDHRKFTSLQNLEMTKNLNDAKKLDVKKPNGYNNLSTNWLTNKLKDLSSNSTIGRVKAQSHNGVANLKPVIKKTNVAVDGTKRPVVRTCSAEPPKKVTFSAFATVQVV